MKKHRFLITAMLMMFAALGGMAGPVCAADKPVQISIDKRQVILGDSCIFSIRVDQELDATPQIPSSDGLLIEPLGMQQESFTHFSLVINGRQVKTNKSGGGVVYSYKIVPKKTGTLNFPPVDITLKGKTYRTNPFTIDVRDTTATPSSDIFVVQEFDKKQVYMGEKIHYTFKWYFDKDIEGYECSIPWLSSRDHFIVQDPPLDKNTQYQRFTINGSQEVPARKTVETYQGKRYAVITFEKTLIPMAVGDYTLDPAFLRCDIVKAYARPQGGRSFFDNFFSSDFDNFFGLGRQAVTEPFVAKTQPVTIHVKRLPQDTQPDTFSQAIGRFVFKAQVTPATVKEGEPVTVTMHIAGEGNLQQIQMPNVSEPEGFRGYEPESTVEEKTVNGKHLQVKTFKKVIIPTLEGAYSIPEIAFTYFDTEKNEYRTIRQGPFPITVTPGEQPKEDVRVISVGNTNGQEKKAIEVIRHDIQFIKTDLGPVSRRSRPVYRQPVFLSLLAVIPPLCLLLLAVYNKQRMKLKTDTVYAKKVRAYHAAMKALGPGALKNTDGREFSFAVIKVLSGYLAAKSEKDSASITTDVADELRERGLSSALTDAVRELYQYADGIRFGFGAEALDAKGRKAFVTRVRNIIEQVEKEWK